MVFTRSDYGNIDSRVAGLSVNDDHGWGGYQWPQGVPQNLLGQAHWRDLVVTVRVELVPLFELAFQIADKIGYHIYSMDPSGSGQSWGPWSYENRPISGTSTASNHSRGKAIDINAPQNPRSHTFQSSILPALVPAWESIGLFWGGHYSGGTQYDPMHFEYAGTPTQVYADIVQAKTILARLGNPSSPKPATPATKPKEWYEMPLDQQTKDELAKLVHDETLKVIQQQGVGLDPTVYTDLDAHIKAAVQSELLNVLTHQGVGLTQDAIDSVARALGK